MNDLRFVCLPLTKGECPPAGGRGGREFISQSAESQKAGLKDSVGEDFRDKKRRKLLIPPLLLKRGEQISRIKAFVDREIISGVGMISDGGLAC